MHGKFFMKRALASSPVNTGWCNPVEHKNNSLWGLTKQYPSRFV
jgi:hypothetical protein